MDIRLSSTVIGIVKIHGGSVVTLSLDGIRLESLTQFAGILSCMPNLRTLITLKTSISWSDDTPAAVNLPELKHLKTLQMAGSQYRILKCLKKAKLTTIRVLNSLYDHSLDCKDLEVFLKSQDTLETLAIRAVYHNKSMLFRSQNLSAPMPFQLTRLSLLYIELELDLQPSPSNTYNNLLKFMEQQARTLVELELGHKFPGFVYEFVFAKMSSLKTLNVMMGQMPQQKEFFQRLVVNQSIENLIFKESPRYSDESAQFYRYFLKCLPNATSLTINSDCCNEIMQIIAQTLKKLKTLRVGYGAIFKGVQFANLNSLHIENTDEDFDWNAFTKANSRLNELTIEYAETDLNLNDIESITRNTNLHTLRIGGDFKADHRFLQIMRKNCPNLKRLELSESCGLTTELLKQSDLLDVTQLCMNSSTEYPYQYSTFWNGHTYSDVDEWDEEAGTVDMFDYHMMDIDMEQPQRYFTHEDEDESADDEDEDERDEFDHYDYDNAFGFHLDYD